MAVGMGCVDNSPNPCSAVDGGGRNCFSDLLSDEWMLECFCFFLGFVLESTGMVFLIHCVMLVNCW